MKYLLPALLALASGCTPAEKRVDIVLRNDATRPIELRASAGLFSRRFQLMPGEVWRGWVPLEFTAGEIRVEVADDPRFLPVK
jgi:hypothetical protein